MNIFFIPIDAMGKGYYRMYLPYKYMQNFANVQLKVNIPFTDVDLAKSNFIVNQHHCNLSAINYFKERLSNGTIVVTDIDDDYWNIHPSNPARKFWNLQKISMLTEMVRISTAVTVSTENLKNIVSKFNKNTYVIPNYMEMPNNSNQVESSPKIKIGWAGSPSHVSDFSNVIIQVLLDLKKKYGNALELIFVGYIPDKLRGLSLYYDFISSTNFINILNTINIDIGIAPLEDNLFNRSKSPLKYFEYSLVKAATVASDVSPYRNIIHPSRGILVKNTYKQWFDTLSLLITDFLTREKIGYNAYKFVKDNYLIKNNSINIFNIYEGIYAKHRET